MFGNPDTLHESSDTLAFLRIFLLFFRHSISVPKMRARNLQRPRIVI